MKTRMLTVLMAVLIFSGCSELQRPAPSVLKTHESDEGFSIKLPADWETSDPRKSPVGRNLPSAADEPRKILRAAGPQLRQILIEVYDVNDSAQGAERVSNLLETVSLLNEGASDIREVKLNGLTAKKSVYTTTVLPAAENEETKRRIMAVYAPIKTKVFVLSCQTTPADYPNVTRLFDEVAASLTIAPSK